jgi:hypothetical protein
VGTLPIADAADLFIAINKGYFHRAGLTVTPEIIQATSQTTPDLVSDRMDFSLLNYVSTMEIEQNSNIRFKYVAPGTVAAANVSEILVPKGSPITSLADLKGKKIGSPQKYPGTVAAFQRAMAQAQQVAASDHGLVAQTVPTYTSTKAGVASVMSFDVFPTALDPTQLRNAAGIMQQYGFLHTKLDVSQMLQSGPES